MRGQPVWLASLSQRNKKTDKILTTGHWEPERIAAGHELLRRVLNGVGDPDQERLFRMNVTLCVHRAASKSEMKRLPPAFTEAEPIDIAGGPVEVLWENVPGDPSTKPCERPRKHMLDYRQPEVWIPIDCQRCTPCIARATLPSYHPTTIG